VLTVLAIGVFGSGVRDFVASRKLARHHLESRYAE